MKNPLEFDGKLLSSVYFFPKSTNFFQFFPVNFHCNQLRIFSFLSVAQQFIVSIKNFNFPSKFQEFFKIIFRRIRLFLSFMRQIFRSSSVARRIFLSSFCFLNFSSFSSPTVKLQIGATSSFFSPTSQLFQLRVCWKLQ